MSYVSVSVVFCVLVSRYTGSAWAEGHAPGVKAGVRILVDAEHSWLQAAIDHAAEALQARFNRGGVPVVYNTFQCYRRNTHARCVSAAVSRCMDAQTVALTKITASPLLSVNKTSNGFVVANYNLTQSKTLLPQISSVE